MAGFVLFNAFLVVIIISFFVFRKKDAINCACYNAGIVIVVLSLITIWYNAVLRSDNSYFVYMTMALPFIQYKSRKKDVGGHS